MAELAELAVRMSFTRAGAVAASFGLPASAGRPQAAVADLAPLLDGIGRAELPQSPDGADGVILARTGMRAGRRRWAWTATPPA